MILGSAYVLTLALAGELLGRGLCGARVGRLERWALGGATALGALTLLAFLQGWAGLGLPGPLVQLAELTALCLAAPRLARRPSARRSERAPQSSSAAAVDTGAAHAAVAAHAASAHTNTVAPRPRLAPRVVLALTLLLALLAAGDWVRAEPAGNWDGMANWATQARHLARTDGDPGQGLRARLVGHPDYPLLLPLGLALGWRWTGDETQHVPRLLAVFFVALLAAGAVGAYTRVAGDDAGALAAAALLAAPGLQLAARGQIADVPLAALTLLAGTRLVAALDAARAGRAPSSPAWLAGLLLGLLPWTKNEGMLLAACLVLAALPALLANLRRAPRLLPALALGAALPLLVVRLYRHAWAPQDRMLANLRPALRRFLPDPERWELALDGLAREFVPLEFGGGASELLAAPWLARWGGLTTLIVAALLLGALRRPRRAHGVPLLATLGWLAALVLIYVLTIADDPQWHVDTSLWRLLLQMLPFALFGALAAWSRPGSTAMLRDSSDHPEPRISEPPPP